MLVGICIPRRKQNKDFHNSNNKMFIYFKFSVCMNDKEQIFVLLSAIRDAGAWTERLQCRPTIRVRTET